MQQESDSRGSALRVLLGGLLAALPVAAQDYVVVDTGQTASYGNTVEIADPLPGQAFYGQDSQYDGAQPSFTVSADGLTVLDDNTGLTWQQSPDTNADGSVDSSDKLNWVDFQAHPAALNAQVFGGFDDWRRPTIKELYSLIDFSGIDVSGLTGSTAGLTPFIDTDVFEFEYGDESIGERIIDAQYWSDTEYVSTTMGGDATAFGVNFADGRIKGYPRDTGPGGQPFTEFVRCVRGNTDYGINDFVDNGNGTVTDQATGLMWMQSDSGSTYNWEDSLDYAENLSLAGHDDWRLPNAKELQSILDYTRSPATTGSAAIDPVFDCTLIVDEGGGSDYPFYWTSTTHANSGVQPGAWGAYVCFGEALGWMLVPFPPGTYVLQDVHGAGSQRSDPKDGNPASYPNGHGPQGDVVRIFQHVRCVRGSSGVGDAWADLGNGLGGAHGIPDNAGSGTLVGGDPVSFTLSDALQNSTTYFVMSATLLNASFKGGILVPDPTPPGYNLALPTGATGSVVLGGTWPAGMPSGFALYTQWWVQDPAGPSGWAASNAISGTTP